MGPQGVLPQSRLWPPARGAGPGLAMTVALLPRMEGRWQPSCWAWSLLAMALVTGSASSTGTTVSGAHRPSPTWADAESCVARYGTGAWGIWSAHSPGPPPLPGARLTCRSGQPLGGWVVGSGHSGVLAGLAGRGLRGLGAPLQHKGLGCSMYTDGFGSCRTQAGCPPTPRPLGSERGWLGLASGSCQAPRRFWISRSGST